MTMTRPRSYWTATALVATVALAVLLGGCEIRTAGAPASHPAPPASSSAPVPVAPVAVHTLTAAQVARALKAHGLPVTGIQVLSAASDPNHLLGRPGEYTSKSEFEDSRITGEAGQGVTAGGSVEVFAGHAGAVRRARYIQAVVQAAPAFGAEYDYVVGAVLLRVSGQLTPAQARQYKRALAAITGELVTGPVG
jgi:hypothetical protein